MSKKVLQAIFFLLHTKFCSRLDGTSMTADRLLQIKQEEVNFSLYCLSQSLTQTFSRFDECKSSYRWCRNSCDRVRWAMLKVWMIYSTIMLHQSMNEITRKLRTYILCKYYFCGKHNFSSQYIPNGIGPNNRDNLEYQTAPSHSALYGTLVFYYFFFSIS